MDARGRAGDGSGEMGGGTSAAQARKSSSPSGQGITRSACVTFFLALLVGGARAQSSGGGAKVKICVAGDFETPSAAQMAISQNLALTALSAARDYSNGRCELASYPGCLKGSGADVVSEGGGLRVETVVVNYGYSLSALSAVLAIEECADLGAHAVYMLGDSEMTQTASVVALARGLLMATSTASTSDLSLAEKFPGVVRSIPDAAASAGAIVSLFQKLGWDKAFFIHSDDPYGRSVTDRVKSMILGSRRSIEGSDVGSAAAADGDEVSMRNAVTLASNSGAHVIVLVVRYFNVDGILFAAEEAGILGDGYAWLTTGSLLPNEALSASSDPDRVGALMTGMLRVAFDPSWDEARDALGGSLAAGGTAPLAEAMADVGTPVDLSPNAPYYTTIYSGYAYDMMWALCMGLDRLAAPGGPLEAGAPPPANLSSVLFDAMTGITFDGTTGAVGFDSQGDRDLRALSFSFWSSVYDGLAGEMATVAAFRWTGAGGVEEHPLGTGRFAWPGGREYPDYVPLSGPEAGPGDGKTLETLAVVLGLALAIVALLALLYVKFSKDVGHAYSSYLIRAAKQRGPPEEGERVCLVVTDIQNSTGLWDTFPEAMSAGHAKHDSCLRGLLRKYCGYECCTEGDSFTVAFHAAEDAIEWCVDVQMTLMRLDWPWDLLDGGASVVRTAAKVEADSPNRGLGDNLGPSRGSFPDVRTLSSFTAGMMPSPSTFTAGMMPSPSTFTAGMMPSPSTPMRSPQHHNLRGASEVDMAGGSLRGGSVFAPHRAAAFPSVGTVRAGASYKGAAKGQGEWRGLRVRMGIHAGLPDRVTRRGNRTVYEGRVERLANLACSAAAGGQVLITGAALGAMVSLEDSSRRAFKDVLFVHLGNWLLHQKPDSHDSRLQEAVLDSPHEGAGRRMGQGTSGSMRYTQDLVMVLPTKLRGRCPDYHQPKALEQLSPGFFEAPSAEEVTIVFTFIDEALELYSTDRPQMEASVQLHNTCIRQALLENSGYECEEQSGNFLLAFHTAGDAVRFARQAQKELMQLPWDRSLLQMPSAARVVFDGELVLCGLRVKMGMTSGRATKRVPSNLTGRADFYGGILNHAARIAAMANGGQIVASRDTVDRLTPEEEAEGGAMVASLGVHTLRNAVGGGAELFQVTIDKRNLRGVPMLRGAVRVPSDSESRHADKGGAKGSDNGEEIAHDSALDLDRLTEKRRPSWRRPSSSADQAISVSVTDDVHSGGGGGGGDGGDGDSERPRPARLGSLSGGGAPRPVPKGEGGGGGATGFLVPDSFRWGSPSSPSSSRRSSSLERRHSMHVPLDLESDDGDVVGSEVIRYMAIATRGGGGSSAAARRQAMDLDRVEEALGPKRKSVADG